MANAAGHHHHTGPEIPLARVLGSTLARRGVTVAVVVSTACTLVGLGWIWPSQGEDTPAQPAFDAELVDATVVGEDIVACFGAEPDAGAECNRTTIEITSGPTTGDESSFELFSSEGGPDFDVGDKIVASYVADGEPGFEYSFADYQRRDSLQILLLLFVASVLVLGLTKGLRALLGAAVSLAALIWIVLPALLDGTSPVAVALVCSSFIALLALYLTHGVSYRTSVAYLGTVASLGLTGLLAAIFISMANVTGFADEDAVFLQLSTDQIDLTGLLLAGIVIGTLGVLDDVTVTQVSAVWELRAADPSRTRLDLYRSALSIGRDHIASSVNTLVLAYAGASLPLLLLFTQADRALIDVANGEVVAVEIIRALVGSIGLVASVPLTTGLAVAVTSAPTRAAGPAPDETDVESPEPPADDDPEPTPTPEPEPEPASWSDFHPREDEF